MGGLLALLLLPLFPAGTRALVQSGQDWVVETKDKVQTQFDRPTGITGIVPPTPEAEPPTVTRRAPAPTPTPLPTRTNGPTATSADLRSYFLQLINRDRAANGLSSVTLGDNQAAQQHAEEMLEHSYAGHWGLDGLKPYMRYTLAGGVNYEAENTSGVKTAPDPNLRYRTTTPKQEIREAQEGLMASPGHRANILRPWHKKVNLGIACNRTTCAVVQQFEGGYISFGTGPNVFSGQLRFAGEMSGGFELSGVQIWYDQPVQKLSLGQLDTTYCYSHGAPVAFLREPVPPRSFYNKSSSRYSWEACPSPYDAPSDAPRAFPGISSRLVGLRQVPWITAESWTGGREFNTLEVHSPSLIGEESLTNEYVGQLEKFLEECGG